MLAKIISLGRVFSLALLLAQPSLGLAKRFSNQYTEFELPPGWECALEGSEWVCQAESKDRRKEAIIILAAKTRGPQDSLDQYMLYLKAPKTYTLPGGKAQVSEAKYTNMKEINGHQWVDSLHLASEVPGFYTRYLATVKEDLGVAITFSVGKDFYDSYQGVFDKIVDTIRVFRQKQVNLADYKRKKSEDLLGQQEFSDDDGKEDMALNQKKATGKGAGSGDDMMLYLGIAAVVIIFIIIKKRKG